MKQRGRILIVDDDALIVNVLRHILCKEYTLDSAGTGNSCLAKLLTFKPHLVLLDIVMPGIDGHETCRRIKLSPQGEFVQIILISAQETIVDQVRGSDVLADDCIVKPFDQQEVLSKVRAQFRMRDAQVDSESSNTRETDLQQERLAVALRRLEKQLINKQTIEVAPPTS